MCHRTRPLPSSRSIHDKQRQTSHQSRCTKQATTGRCIQTKNLTNLIETSFLSIRRDVLARTSHSEIRRGRQRKRPRTRHKSSTVNTQPKTNQDHHNHMPPRHKQSPWASEERGSSLAVHDVTGRTSGDAPGIIGKSVKLGPPRHHASCETRRNRTPQQPYFATPSSCQL